MTAIRRRISTPFSGVSGIPATVAEPAVGSMSVPSVRTVVVLPAPFGPRKPKTSPRPTSNETSSKATAVAERFGEAADRKRGLPVDHQVRTVIAARVSSREFGLLVGWTQKSLAQQLDAERGRQPRIE